jgi:hypothetical protein
MLRSSTPSSEAYPPLRSKSISRRPIAALSPPPRLPVDTLSPFLILRRLSPASTAEPVVIALRFRVGLPNGDKSPTRDFSNSFSYRCGELSVTLRMRSGYSRPQCPAVRCGFVGRVADEVAVRLDS